MVDLVMRSSKLLTGLLFGVGALVGAVRGAEYLLVGVLLPCILFRERD